MGSFRRYGSELSERKRSILRTLIQQYVAEVRPVSSHSVAENFSLSSATLRNELSALEELGYLKQLHTSGGRVPTDLAYRFFVEDMAGYLTDSLEQQARVEQVYTQLGNEIETLLEGTIDLLSAMTGYVAWVSLPASSALNIKSINFVEVDVNHLLVVLVTGDGTLQSRMVQTELPVSELNTGALAERLNNYLRGRSVLNVDYAQLRSLVHQALDVPAGLAGALEQFFAGLTAQRERVVFGNALRLVLEPEFSNRETLNSVLGGIEDKDRFVRALRSQLGGQAMQTIIGSENEDSRLHECSLVISRFVLPGGSDGTLGVLGPTRQHYERSLSWVKVVGEAVAKALREASDSSKGGPQ